VSDEGLTVAQTWPEYIVGVDLGKAQDFTAIAVLDRSKVMFTAADPATRQRVSAVRTRLVAMERVALATTYPDIVGRVEQVVKTLANAPATVDRTRAVVTLVVDATGVGGPVVDMLRAARLPCTMVPVEITGGSAETRSGETWRVPKRDLVVGLQTTLQQKALEIAARLPMRGELMNELLAMRATLTEGGRDAYAAKEGTHDDLVIALALAVWRARTTVRKSGWGTVRLV
jgi:hypothetical protein